MPSFSCDGCGDVVKKPKLDSHSFRCGASMTCLDCSTTFYDPSSWKPHTTCISEAQKYQKSLYKPPSKNKKNSTNDQSIKQNNQFKAAIPVTPIILPSTNSNPINTPVDIYTIDTAVKKSVKNSADDREIENLNENKKDKKSKKKDKKRKLEAETTINQPQAAEAIKTDLNDVTRTKVHKNDKVIKENKKNVLENGCAKDGMVVSEEQPVKKLKREGNKTKGIERPEVQSQSHENSQEPIPNLKQSDLPKMKEEADKSSSKIEQHEGDSSKLEKQVGQVVDVKAERKTAKKRKREKGEMKEENCNNNDVGQKLEQKETKREDTRNEDLAQEELRKIKKQKKKEKQKQKRKRQQEQNIELSKL